jgi:hypothetical protein
LTPEAGSVTDTSEFVQDMKEGDGSVFLIDANKPI